MTALSRGVLVTLLSISVLCLLGNPATTAMQKEETKPAKYIPDLMAWIEEHYGIAQAYQRGEIDVALERLSQRSIEQQRQIVERIMGVLLVTQVEKVGQNGRGYGSVDVTQRRPGVPLTAGDQSQRTDVAGRTVVLPEPAAAPARRVPRFEWTVAMLPIAGALHMEAALAAYRRNDAVSTQNAAEQIKIADGYFGFYERHTGKPTASRKWQLAIGLTIMANARFGLAATLLDDACAKFVDDGPLQLACGSIHETIAMLPADLLAELSTSRTARPIEDNPLTEVDESRANRYRGSMIALAQARSARAGHLKRAARAFEIVLASDVNNTEAQLRLAHVRTMQGNDELATRLLEPLVARPRDTPPRIAYLARLYLGALRARQRQTQAAATLLEQAIELLPSGRSAYLALASVARSQGNNEVRTAVLHRMMNAPTSPPDPWIESRFGQYWVADPLVAELRKEAQRQ